MTTIPSLSVRRERNATLDAIAGFLILFMLCTHYSIVPTGPRTVGGIFQFYMAWFFFKSGMYHKTIGRDKYLPAVKKWARRLLAPFFIFTLFGFLMSLILCHDFWGVVYSYVAQVLTMGFAWGNAPLWFLSTLFLTKVITGRLSDGNLRWYMAIGLIIAFVYHLVLYERFNYVGNTGLAVFYYSVGYYFRHKCFRPAVYATLLVGYLCAVFLFPTFLDVRSDSTGHGYWTVAVLGVIPAILATNFFMGKIDCSRLRLLTYFGRNAMSYLCLHFPIMLVFRELIEGGMSLQLQRLRVAS